MTPFGIDISSYQGANINYDLMKQKTKFVAVRAGISWGFEDPVFAQSWQALKGHNRIAYHVVYPSQDAIRQSDWCLDIINRAGVDWRFDRIALDLELDQSQTRARITQVTLDMMEYLRGVTGRYPLLYSRASWVDAYMTIKDDRLKLGDWWLAHYLARRDPEYTPEKDPPPLIPRGVGKWLIHQTSERGIGREHGVSSNYIDTNRWNKTYKDMDAYFGRDGRGEPPIEPPAEILEPLFTVRVARKTGAVIRALPSADGREVDRAGYNAVLNVYDVKAGWYKVHPTEPRWTYSRYLRKWERKNRKPSDLRKII